MMEIRVKNLGEFLCGEISGSDRWSSRRYKNWSLHQKLSIFWICLVCTSFPRASLAVPVTYRSAAVDADSVNNSLTAEPYLRPSLGCRYKAVFYTASETVPTDEPCLRCACQSTAVVCKLRICAHVPSAPPPGCLVVHKAKTCCAELVCPESRKFTGGREQRLSNGNTNDSIIPMPAGEGFCVADGTVYAEGSAMKSSTLCEHCFCIRGEMKCSKPQCVIPLNGCKPRYRSFACCPTNYDCNESNATAILQTIPTSTPIPSFLKGCQVRGRFVHEGEPVLPMHLEPDNNNTNPCQTCFCMGGVVRCRTLECDPPMPGCTPITVEGHCCPDHYECGAKSTTLPQQAVSIASTARSQLGGIIHNDIVKLDVEIPKKVDAAVPAPGANESSTTPETIPAPQHLIQPNMPEILVGNHTTASPGKLKSDVGSREERRNKDKVDYKTSYEDDEKDDSASIPISLEVMDPDFMSKISFDETTTQQIPESKSDIEPEAVTVFQMDEQTLAVSDIVTEMDNELIEQTTMLQPVPPLEAVEEPSVEVESTTQNSTYTSAPITSAANLATLSNTDFTATTLSDNSIENLANATTTSSQAPTFESQHIDSAVASTQSEHFTTTVPTIAENSTSISTTANSSLTEVHFISFGEEDAMVNPLKEIYEARSPQSGNLPIKITFDQSPLEKVSLIPPTPPRGYVHVPLFSSSDSINPIPVSSDDLDPISTIQEPFLPKLDLRNGMMDVPVSTSLYNNGYYQNGIITNAQNPEPSAPGQVFDDSSERILGVAGSQPVNESMPQNPPEAREEVEEPFLFNIQNFKNPLRTYSKFGIHDSPFYRYEYPNEQNSHANSRKKDKDDFVYSEGPSTTSHRMTAGTGSSFQHPGYSKTKHTPFLDYDLDPVMYDEDLLDLTSFERSEPQDFFTAHERGKASSQNPIIVTPSTLHTHAYRNNMPTAPSPIRDEGFKPVVAFPFKISKSPAESFLSHGLKLSGCNIYGKMYTLGNVIRELSSNCVRCECTESGVQCSEQKC